MQPQFLQEHLPVLRLHLGKLFLQFAADGDDAAAFGPGDLHHLPVEGIIVQVAGKIRFAEIRRVDDRLVGKQGAVGNQLFFFLAAFKVAGGFSLAQPGVQTLEEGGLRQRLFIAALGRLFAAVDPTLHQVDIGKHQLQVDGLDIPRRADIPADMDDLTVPEAADDVDDGIHLPDVGKEFVAQTLALGSALYQPGDIHKLNHGGRDLIGVVHFAQLVQTGVRHRDDADVGLDGAEGIVGRAGRAAGQGVKNGAFADVGQTHDTEFHNAVLPFCGSCCSSL